MKNTTVQAYIRRHQYLLAAPLMIAALTLGCINIASAESKTEATKPAGLTTLITETPEAGFALAVKLSQKGVSTVQTDPEVRKKQRPEYSHDADSLIAVSQVVAINFQTVAAANNYWRK
ncbi:hexameric tyrosine-coordinated heme protein [Castellaniella sp.]|uniref:hexameric tyrosine-coordinated heme protein n=1 Tax=Castellaniella sp. TaxID=1955812 RepID=UPI002B00153A|nr:hexameric tyrosine-coordinated heme protein [Castellaniella sp.]